MVEFAQQTDYIAKVPPEAINAVRTFVSKKKSSLTVLKLYECDGYILEQLAKGGELESLEELMILKFHQSTDSSSALKDLLPVGNFRNLERLSLCATYYPLRLEVA